MPSASGSTPRTQLGNLATTYNGSVTLTLAAIPAGSSTRSVARFPDRERLERSGYLHRRSPSCAPAVGPSPQATATGLTARRLLGIHRRGRTCRHHRCSRFPTVTAGRGVHRRTSRSRTRSGTSRPRTPARSPYPMLRAIHWAARRRSTRSTAWPPSPGSRSPTVDQLRPTRRSAPGLQGGTFTNTCSALLAAVASQPSQSCRPAVRYPGRFANKGNGRRQGRRRQPGHDLQWQHHPLPGGEPQRRLARRHPDSERLQRRGHVYSGFDRQCGRGQAIPSRRRPPG